MDYSLNLKKYLILNCLLNIAPSILIVLVLDNKMHQLIYP